MGSATQMWPSLSTAIPLGRAKQPMAVAVLAELADELAVGVENLDPLVQGVGDVNVAVLVERDVGGQSEIARAWSACASCRPCRSCAAA